MLFFNPFFVVVVVVVAKNNLFDFNLTLVAADL